jgi:hypothetical protein
LSVVWQYHLWLSPVGEQGIPGKKVRFFFLKKFQQNPIKKFNFLLEGVKVTIGGFWKEIPSSSVSVKSHQETIPFLTDCLEKCNNFFENPVLCRGLTCGRTPVPPFLLEMGNSLTELTTEIFLFLIK